MDDSGLLRPSRLFGSEQTGCGSEIGFRADNQRRWVFRIKRAVQLINAIVDFYDHPTNVSTALPFSAIAAPTSLR